MTEDAFVDENIHSRGKDAFVDSGPGFMVFYFLSLSVSRALSDDESDRDRSKPGGGSP